jgi:hypothetical protein
MPAVPARTRARRIRLVAGAFAGGLLLTFLPVPTPSFMAVAVSDSAFLPLEQSVGAAELQAQAGAAEEPIGDDRVSGAETAADEFDLIGVTLDEVPAQPVLVRVQDVDGTWGEWNELEVDPDFGAEPGSAEAAAVDGDAIVTEPLWVGGATGYEVSVGADDADGVDVMVVREETQRTVAESTPLADAAQPAPFGINSRASWGARAAKNSPSVAPALKLAVVHHTASSNSYTSGQVPGILRSIQAYHMDGNDWSDIAYNFLVDRFGGIWEGRGGGTTRAVVGAHAKGFNTGSVGVSVIGNFVGANAPSAAIEAVSRVVGYRLQVDYVDPQARVNFTSLGSTTIPAGQTVNIPTVIGHRDVGATSCPGTIWNSLGSIRNRAKDWYNWMDAKVTPAGGIDSVRVAGSRVDVIGWAADPDVVVPARVHVVLAGRLVEDRADGYRPDVGRAYGVGDHRGWGAGFSNVAPGTHRMCATVINQGDGQNRLLGCRDVVVK